MAEKKHDPVHPDPVHRAPAASPAAPPPAASPPAASPAAGPGDPVRSPPDFPGHAPEPSAPSGAKPADTPGLSPPGQGGQVILTGDAQTAARGGTHGDIVSNTQARDEAVVEGHVASGTTADAAAGAISGNLAETDDPIDEHAKAGKIGQAEKHEPPKHQPPKHD